MEYLIALAYLLLCLILKGKPSQPKPEIRLRYIGNTRNSTPQKLYPPRKEQKHGSINILDRATHHRQTNRKGPS